MMIKTAQRQDSPSSEKGSVLGTMLNPFQGRMGTKRYTPDWFTPFGGKDGKPSSEAQLLFHALALAATYSALTGAARLVGGRGEKDRIKDKMRRDLQALVNSRQVILSPDPSLQDAESEKQLLEMGLPPLPEPKILQLKKLPQKLKKLPQELKKLPQELKKLPWRLLDKESQVGGTTTERLSMVLPTLAILGSAYGAYKLVDHFQDRLRRRQLDAQIAEERNILDKLNFQELLAARGGLKKDSMQKSAQLTIRQSIGNWLYGIGRRESDQDNQNSRTTWTGGAAGLAMLVAALAFGTGAVASKKYFDKRDEARLRLKSLKEAARRAAMSTNSSVIMPIFQPAVLERLNRHLDGGGSALTKHLQTGAARLPLPEPTAAPADPTDTIMQQIMNG